LVENLRQAYNTGEKTLDSFKAQKSDLKDAYKEHEDILKEEGIEDFAGMLEANNEEQEVKQYRRAGGRGKDGETGKLYKDVSDIKTIKANLLVEMPKGTKLNFAATTKKEEEMSNRDFSFSQIENYVTDLDKEIESIKIRQEEAYLETNEGKREEINKKMDPDNDLNRVSLKDFDNFYLSTTAVGLAEKVGPEAIKEVYTEKLTDELTKEAWRKKSKDGYESEEQLKVKNYPALNKLNELSYDSKDLDSFNDAYQDALDHLSEILKDKGDGSGSSSRERLQAYGLGGNRDKKYENWDEEHILADAYLKHAESMIDLNPEFNNGFQNHDSISEQFKTQSENQQARHFTKQTVYSPELFKASFQNYTKFFEYIKNNTDDKTELVGDNRKDPNTLIAKFKNPEFRKEVGILEANDSQWPKDTKLEVPVDFIEKNHGFYEALSNAERSKDAWEEEKNGIKEISKSAVDFRFESAWNSHFKFKNNQVLENYESDKKLAKQIELNLNRGVLLNNPDFADRKVKLERTYSSSGDRALTDLTANEEHKRISAEQKVINEEIASHIKQKQQTLNEEAGKLRRAMISFGRDGKLKKVKEKYDIFENYKQGNKINEKEAQVALGEEEVQELKNLRERKNEKDQEYKEYDKKRSDFLYASDSKNFFLDFKDDDILNKQEMLLKQLPEMLKMRQAELETSMDSMPREEKEILAEY
ncbi:MAG TPA: hypothetical protein VFD45_02620, partial [Patescibacteria group bacterium]|nr:hypothetical protein [Patescibacteria group bacterium]